ncbi:MAG: hypothetical protein M9894_31255 [Planctomycetes bacterium]|nr:hypothetical protein [Planctomycetota bacterium]
MSQWRAQLFSPFSGDLQVFARVLAPGEVRRDPAAPADDRAGDAVTKIPFAGLSGCADGVFSFMSERTRMDESSLCSTSPWAATRMQLLSGADARLLATSFTTSAA